MTSFWKIAAPVAFSIAIAGAAILWFGYNEKVKERGLVETARTCRVSAERGDAKAQYSLGHMYYHGEGLPQDFAEAARWYRKAADQGDAKGEYGLGYMYYHGQGVPQDYAEALRWYSKAADQGDASGEVNLASMYYYGQGVAQDYAEALRWYHKGANQGDAMSEDALGLMYLQGHGVPQDFAEAAHWYRHAADQGFADAQYSLGYMYYYGQGVKQDRAEANHLFHKAADQGNESARRTLAVGLTLPRELFLAVQFIGGVVLTGGSLLLGRRRWTLRRTVVPATGILCLVTSMLSWHGYTHYMIWCASCGFNAFTSVKWLLNAALLGLLIYIVRTEKRADWQV